MKDDFPDPHSPSIEMVSGGIVVELSRNLAILST
jgi:hypothetical protein